MLEWIQSLSENRDTLILMVPVIFAGVIILIVVLSNNWKKGLGFLAAGAGIFWLISIFRKNRLQEAFEREDELAGDNDEYADFKSRQKDRYNAVMANKTVIDELETRKKLLEQTKGANKTEIAVLNKEITERKSLLDDLLSGVGDFFGKVKDWAGDLKKDWPYDVYDQEEKPEQVDKPDADPVSKPGKYVLNGHRLVKL